MKTDDSAHAQAKMPPSQPNPALTPLEGLVGHWEWEYDFDVTYTKLN
jgi:hypothetical protein